MLLVAFLMWIGFAAGVGMFASSRGRDFVGWVVIALLISPLFAIVLVAVLPDGPGYVPIAEPTLLNAATASDLLDRLEKLFDRGALTLFDLQRLKILGSREMPPPPPTPVPGAEVSEFTRPCPKCGGLVHPQATTCMHCWAKLGKQAA